MAYDIDLDRIWRRVSLAGHGDATAEVRGLLPEDYHKLTTVTWCADCSDPDGELRRIISQNSRSFEGLTRAGEPISTPDDVWERGTPRLISSVSQALIVASHLSADDLGKL